jgi:predicted phosphodiesterase
VRRLLLTLAALFLAQTAVAHEGHLAGTPPWQQASAWPDRIVVTFADDPARTLAITWRTNVDATHATAEIVKASPAARFDVGATAMPARTEALELASVKDAARALAIPENAGLPAAHFHSVVFRGLEPDTLYAYRVSGAGGKWSEWFQVRTAPTQGPITFLYVGDAQNGILSHWARTIRAAYAKAPDARFIIHAGDMVDQGSRDFEWAQWFKAVGFIHGMIPAIPVAGNHEYSALKVDESTTRRLLSILWRPQFTLPEDAAAPDLLKETMYAVRYNSDLEVFVLDSNFRDVAVTAKWLDDKLSASTARWKVATFHHPVFSSGRNRDNPGWRDAILPVLRKHGVDLVLQGHDHTYARGAVPQSPERYSTQRGGVVESMFVNSVSGAKMYEFSEGDWARYEPNGVRLERQAENTQFFQRIHIDGEVLDYEAWTADGQLYDAFTLRKDRAGRKRVTQGKSATMDPRRFTDSEPNRGTDGLND